MKAKKHVLVNGHHRVQTLMSLERKLPGFKTGFNERLYARCPECGFQAGRGVNGMLAKHGTDCRPIKWQYARDIEDGKALGPVTLELYGRARMSFDKLYAWSPRTQTYGCLSDQARRCLRGGYEQVSGMSSPNEYWLPQAMSEAIEAAEALGL